MTAKELRYNLDDRVVELKNFLEEVKDQLEKGVYCATLFGHIEDAIDALDRASEEAYTLEYV